ncbi:pyridoxal phosphate-dependent aminotransferase [Paenibacillus beijingensis]|uniref:pyridoxal phosphate-dependent aminotransferase n=1 Tax=Paenibacillus beijingensis TaxID=1126833 RepID=UPI000AE6D2E5|nr:aminotransferase class I/II-fold pyridoxal phosphate-dependent enzyme [Paenibacillus beijingensis]
MASITQYPDPAVRGLRRKLAKRHGVGEEHILVGNGAAELIDLAVRARRPRRTGLVQPCFAEYGDAAVKAESHIAAAKLSEEDGFELRAHHLQAETGREADMWLIGSPNNPTGRIADPRLLLHLAQASGSLVAVDEAFMDFVPEERTYSLVRQAVSLPNLLVFRSMTKFYSVPGIRLGYVIGSEQRIAELRRLQVPWSVNSLAQQIGEAVLEDDAFAERTGAWLRQERPWLADELRKLGLTVYPGDVNYILFRLPDTGVLKEAGELQRRMGRCGVLIRDASHFAGLGPGFCRVAVKLREHNERLIRALRSCLEQAAEGGAGR